MTEEKQEALGIKKLQEILLRAGPASSREALFKRATARFDNEYSPKREQYATLVFSIKDGNKPLASAPISVFDDLGDPIQWDGTRRTTEDGRGVVSLSLSMAQNKPTLKVALGQKPEKEITIKHLMPA